MFIPPPHTQEIVFDNKTRLTLRGVKRIEAGNWTHIECNGKEYITNTDRILFIKVYKDKTDYEAKRNNRRQRKTKAKNRGKNVVRGDKKVG